MVTAEFKRHVAAETPAAAQHFSLRCCILGLIVTIGVIINNANEHTWDLHRENAPLTSQSLDDAKKAAVINATDVKRFRTQCWQKRDTILYIAPRVSGSSFPHSTAGITRREMVYYTKLPAILHRAAYKNSLRLDARSGEELIATPLLSRHRALLRSVVVIGLRDELHEAFLGASLLNGTCFVELTKSSTIETLRRVLCSCAITDNKILTYNASGLETHDSCPFSHKDVLEVEKGECHRDDNARLLY